MSIPRLIHPVNVTIERRDDAQTVFDDDYREPVQFVERLAPVVVQGQVNWYGEKDQKLQGAGVARESDGYVLFRFTDLDRLGFQPQLGDRFTALGRRAVNIYVVKLMPLGHYPDTNGPSLLKAFFRDREPARGV